MDKKVQFKTVDYEKAVVFKTNEEYEDFNQASNKISNWITKNNLKISGPVHMKAIESPVDFPSKLSYELKVPIVDEKEDEDEIRIIHYPEHQSLTIFHKGPYKNLNGVHLNLEHYAWDNDFEITSIPSEIYLNDPHEFKSENLLTEIQIGVKPYKFEDIELEGGIDEIVVKKERAAVITHKGPVEELARMQSEMSQWCIKNNVDPDVSSVRLHKHPEGVDFYDMAFDIRVYLGDKDVTAEEPVKVVEIPEHKAVRAIYKGPYSKLPNVHAMMKDYCRKNGCDVIDYNEEIYLNNPFKVKANELLTEVRMPIVKLNFFDLEYNITPVKLRTFRKAKIIVGKFKGSLEEVPRYREYVQNWIKDNNIIANKLMFVRYLSHPCAVNPDEMIFETGTSVADENESILIVEYPLHRVLSVKHRGPYNELEEVSEFLMDYAKKNGYIKVDYPEYVYLEGYEEKDGDNLLTEVQLHVKKL